VCDFVISLGVRYYMQRKRLREVANTLGHSPKAPAVREDEDSSRPAPDSRRLAEPAASAARAVSLVAPPRESFRRLTRGALQSYLSIRYEYCLAVDPRPCRGLTRYALKSPASCRN
jgi:hypothetical protein